MPLAGRKAHATHIGIIAMHPHPLTDTGLAVIIAGNDDDGLELAARLFPIRTGVTASPAARSAAWLNSPDESRYLIGR